MNNFINKNHELAWRCVDAGIPITLGAPKDDASSLPGHRGGMHQSRGVVFTFEAVTTDKNQIDQYWSGNPIYVPVIWPYGECFVYTVTVPHDVNLPHDLEETLHYVDDDGSTVYLFDDYGEIPVNTDETIDVTEEIFLSAQPYCILPSNTAGPVVLAPLPEWILNFLWGEEFRGSPLDTPPAVEAAKSLLRVAKPPADFIGYGTLRPTKEKVIEAERRVGDPEVREHYREEARRLIENAERKRDTTQLFDICKQIFDLGISEARARVLIDLYWNESGHPPYTTAEMSAEFINVWRLDWERGALRSAFMSDIPGRLPPWISEIPRRLRWRYREVDWLTAEDESEDLLLGEVFSTTTRAMLYAPTGAGKTMFALELAAHVANGSDFLHWSGSGKSRGVLYVDGEMSKSLMRVRFQDAIRRLGTRPPGLEVLNREHTPELPSLDTVEGQRWLNRYIEDQGPFDLIVFDNIASLLAGSMIGPESWKVTLPWVRDLTARGIAQIWTHHTGIDQSHAYGDSTREFAMDTVIKIDPVGHAKTGVCFKFSFQKARRKTPDNLNDFETVQISLVDDQWQSSGAGTGRVALFERTLIAAGATSEETAISHADLAKLLADETVNAATWRPRIAAAAQTKPYQHLVVSTRKGLHWRAGR
jgi:hypothetical protein